MEIFVFGVDRRRRRLLGNFRLEKEIFFARCDFMIFLYYKAIQPKKGCFKTVAEDARENRKVRHFI